MIHEAVRSFMVQVFGSASYGIWIKDEYDFQWNNWLREGEVPEYADQEQLESSWKILRYTFDFLSNINICVVIDTQKQLTLLQSERLESLIREGLLKQQIEMERAHNDRWLTGLRELTCSLELNDLLFKIMENALHVIPSLSCGLFMMVDPDSAR